MTISARKELLDNIHQYPNEENNFRKKINRIQKQIEVARQRASRFTMVFKVKEIFFCLVQRLLKLNI